MKRGIYMSIHDELSIRMKENYENISKTKLIYQ